MNINARGGSRMRIGLVAVDKAVFALTDDEGLTRESVSLYLLNYMLILLFLSAYRCCRSLKV